MLLGVELLEVLVGGKEQSEVVEAEECLQHTVHVAGIAKVIEAYSGSFLGVF